MRRTKYDLTKRGKGHKDMCNQKMSDEVYKKRRQVMEFIYEAKSLYPNLPRINVRITNTQHCENNTTIVGVASMSKDVVIWIPEYSLSLPKGDLRSVLFHEILHTAFGIGHKKTGIMTPIMTKGVSKIELEKQFLKEIRLSNNI